ncbi:hypothetical protein [Sphingobacterium sp. MYb388]|uniref:hypothetical protein n=1 Tax=Sphingobacterium sp. MYb388 TaxID=2745437 RepID=UPI0030AAEA66
MFRKFIGRLIGCLGILFFAFISYIGVAKLLRDVNTYSSYENIVTEKRVLQDYRDFDVFALNLMGFNGTLEVYQTFRNYDNLNSEIKIGDKIKVYYESKESKNVTPSFYVLQIEKNDQVIVSNIKKEGICLIIMGFLAVSYMVFIIYRYEKYGESDDLLPLIF